ncbi:MULTISPECIES: HAMP domain-containing sensor histidine kinase [unclassified Polaromonas]|uniref:sensor histidine kinase n=1 Tax=unclassified Polaromonas TaxID=2638319 RepID=UPI0018CA1325|nr:MULTISPECIES: HAMP domain-containing sensor histidine kinase [unclassified Polaromonas]MBG6070778.1 two-component system CAI-1 autoinducer sensor kinase/phosphatase CqsS [Polaromonas sp. CG_9.7]MBG6112913.1 two-component system CAI-1 autoinducer sensor kinase/phosphatase CqsS [Polaromonas sp. CG_9.2]MDH6186386.1 two-component system CAI-1 autoinducer sensor kinase/phosphatase CqsS [Polaromonas sp. CG_23.6]
MKKIHRTSQFLQRSPSRWTLLPLEPLEPILHASPWRIRLLGLASVLGQPLFGWIWSRWLVQPYENLWLRGLMSLLAATLLLPGLTQDFSRPATRWLVTVVMWIEIPLFFSWMYFCNAGSAAWLATTCIIIVCYYQLTDWRIATAGIVSGALLSWALFAGLMPNGLQANPVDMVVIAFSWICALLLGLSSANLRRDQLAHMLATMGIMAHELRTPLSTASLIGDALQMEIRREQAHPRAAKLEQLGQRLQALVRAMNHQIDTQIANAKLLQLPHYSEVVGAASLVTETLAAYPYTSNRQRECVTVVITHDFNFHGPRAQFSQVLMNLMKNALHSLAAADSSYAAGALCITVDCGPDGGSIAVADDGVGVDPALLPHIFKPFFSSNRSIGHGLGLAFCQQVLRSAGGSIQVKSGHATGAVFTLNLPLAPA